MSPNRSVAQRTRRTDPGSAAGSIFTMGTVGASHGSAGQSPASTEACSPITAGQTTPGVAEYDWYDARQMARLLQAMLLLWQTTRAAAAGHGELDERGFEAVPVWTLHQSGFSPLQIEQLVAAGLARLIPNSPATNVHPQRSGFSAALWITLTAEGAAVARRALSALLPERPLTAGDTTSDGPAPLLVPHWDENKRELWYGGVLVKRFERTAPNQELILTVFEEENWPHRIDDPLPPWHSQVPTVRLRNNVNHLNRRMLRALLHFTTDGAGRGICWSVHCPSDWISDWNGTQKMS